MILAIYIDYCLLYKFLCDNIYSLIYNFLRVIDCVDFYINCSKNHYMFWQICKFIFISITVSIIYMFWQINKILFILIAVIFMYLTNKSYIQWYIFFLYLFLFKYIFVAKGSTNHRWGEESPNPTPCTPIHLSWLQDSLKFFQ